MRLVWRWCPFSELDSRDLYAVLRLRSEVFVVEQACAYLDLDGRDQEALHLLGTHEGALVAYLRAFPPDERAVVVLGRVVVAAPARGQGLGRTLMREGLRRAGHSWGSHATELSAQAHLEPFYESLGFRTVGPGYDEDGIPHLPMRRPADALG